MNYITSFFNSNSFIGTFSSLPLFSPLSSSLLFFSFCYVIFKLLEIDLLITAYSALDKLEIGNPKEEIRGLFPDG